MDAPPPIPPRPPGYETIPESAPAQGNGMPPPPPPPPPRPQTSWTHLFYADGSPTPLLESLLAAFWAVLDPQNTGYITPEVLSGFLTVQGWLPEDDVWKANLKPIGGPYQPVDNADFELKACLEAWYFDFRVVERGPPGRPQLPGGGMPLLTKDGFTAYMAVEYAGEPEKTPRLLNAALRAYNIWPAMGPVPREVLPPARPKELQQRIDMAAIRARNAAQEKIAAAKAYYEIRRQGSEAALDLLRPSYVYRYI
ncbi:hypothetical protein GQ53DRAFT_841321 [Thozetella sp. PMI_491]|nr:hypothetical protein GQ53DRAFT_841321 [Thozetella sp. PMI_491]